MNPDTAGQSFELRRFPNLRDPAFRFMGAYLTLQVLHNWLHGLILIGLLLIYWFWRLQRPASYLQLSNTGIISTAGGFRSIKINKSQVEEVSLTSKGVIIAWKKAGVPHYTPVSSAWFDDEVWRKACPALLAWRPAQV
ncbi:MAG: hypothetical protein J0L73_20855 [Verrucomicrobia bacterium]|nr:hypothetical protein [Verrucomicrobiota bacterium]